ncbi:MAG: alpha/beta hydrolase [Desulfobulbaceae bacterium]|nr:alpha/beta hydrolase [Desulfobulbaceae bacterium]
MDWKGLQKTTFILLCSIVPLSLLFGVAACREATPPQKSVNTGHVMDHEDVLRVIFHPRKARKTEAPQQAVNIDAPVAAGVKIGCRLFTHSPAANTIIFFHGNGEIVPDYDDIAPFYLAEGLNFAVCDYRGYGWSDGEPLVSTFLADAEASFLHLRSWLTDSQYTGELFVMGRSLGSACAIEVAAKHSDAVGGLIIESGFAKTLPLAKVLGIDLEQLGIREEDTFNNSAKIVDFTKPTLILHGQYDQLIPLWQAESLHAASGAKQKELQVVPGADHNSLIATAGKRYFTAIRMFIENATGTAPDWRQRRKEFKAAQQAKAEQNQQ